MDHGGICDRWIELDWDTLTAGFVSKLYLILAAWDKDWWWLAGLIVLSSLLAIIYVWRIIEVAYLRDPPEGVEMKEAPLSLLIPAWLWR